MLKILQTMLESVVSFGEKNNKYCTFEQGPNRYPHLNLSTKYDSKLDCCVSTDVSHNAREFLANDICIRELMDPLARRIFVKDLLQMTYSNQEKMEALYSVAHWECPEFEIETIIPEGFGWEEKLPLHLVKLQSPHIFPIGLVAKGTDLAFIDQHTATRGQEIGHAIYHFKEGISTGAENITEVHGDPVFVYALQCLKGRLARRIRKGSSPHRIKFPDYVCLRAFAGTKVTKGTYHGALGLLAPPMNMVAQLVGEEQLLNGLFEGSNAKIEEAVDNYLGEGAYDEIFMSFDVFGRLPKILKRDKHAAEKMFGTKLFESELTTNQIREIWENPELRNDKLIDILEGNA